jgi:hypothetical protein
LNYDLSGSCLRRFHEAPEGAKISSSKKSDEAKPRDIARQNCPRLVATAPFA